MKNITEHLFNYQDIAIVCLINEGLTPEEIADLEIASVHLDNNALELNNRIIQVSPETIDAVMKAYYAQEYYCDNGESEEYFELAESDKIIRGRTNEETTVELIERRIKEIESYL